MLRVLEQTLLAQATRPLVRHPAVAFALEEFGDASHARLVSDVTRRIGLSQRRFIQVFSKEVGLTPKYRNQRSNRMGGCRPGLRLRRSGAFAPRLPGFLRLHSHELPHASRRASQPRCAHRLRSNSYNTAPSRRISPVRRSRASTEGFKARSNSSSGSDSGIQKDHVISTIRILLLWWVLAEQAWCGRATKEVG